ncbi:MAG: transglutaminase domain-containing protein [Faecalibacterium sp.]
MTEWEFQFKAGLRFSAPVIEHVFQLHCLPAEDEVQRLEAYGIRLNPAAGYELHRDGFGNWMVCGSCRPPHLSFAYEAHGIVRVELSRRRPEVPNPVLRRFTPLTEPDAAVYALWSSLPLEGRPLQEQAALLSHGAANALRYTSGVTDNGTTAAQALGQGQGVCQDYAHLLLALARLSGFAARYCMGLIPGEGATHAWAEIALPEGWKGFDPTHDGDAGEDHLRFAVGRDAADCRAENGVFRGAAAQSLHAAMLLRQRG